MPKTARALLQLPPATAAAIERLGADLAVARLRRKESLRTWAARMGVSVPTLQRLEAAATSAGLVFDTVDPHSFLPDPIPHVFTAQLPLVTLYRMRHK